MFAFIATLTAALLLTQPSTASTWQTMTRIQSPASVWTAATRDGTWLYGDSITVGNATALARHLRATTGKQTAVDANSSIPTQPAVDRLAERVKQRGAPKTLIMATGANDAIDPTRASGMTAQVARVRAIVGPRTRVVWVATLVARPKFKTADAAGTRTVNAAVRAAAARGVVNTVAPWDVRLTAAGVYTHTRDGVHPRGPGVNLWVSTVSRSL